MNLLRYKPLFRWAVPLAIILTLAAGAIVAIRIVWAGDGPHGQNIDVYYFDWGVRTCRVGPNQTLIEDVVFETVDGYAFQVPSGNASMMCTFEITDPALLPDQAYHNMGWLCSTPVFGGTYNSKLLVRPDGTMTLICHWNGSSNVNSPSSSTYLAPGTSTPSGDSSPPTDQSSSSDAGGGTGTGDTSTSASDASPTGDTSGNTVDGAGATVEPQGGDNNNGAPPDHAGPQDNSNGNAPDHAGPQDNHDGIDKPNGNGNGNNGNGNGGG